MRQHLLLFLLLLGGLACLIGFLAALVDWVDDFRGGVYHQNPLEALVETSAIVIYAYLATRFSRSKMHIS